VRMCRRCDSLMMMTWSRHSRLMDPIRRSTNGFSQGLAGADTRRSPCQRLDAGRCRRKFVGQVGVEPTKSPRSERGAFANLTCRVRKPGLRRQDVLANHTCTPQEITLRRAQAGTRDEDRRELVSRRRDVHAETGSQPVVRRAPRTAAELPDRDLCAGGRDCNERPVRSGSSARAAH
jgi:hypothetical protein